MNRFFHADWNMWPRHRSRVLSWWGLDEYHFGHDNENVSTACVSISTVLSEPSSFKSTVQWSKSTTFIQIQIHHQTSVMDKNIHANAWALTMCVGAFACMYLCTYTCVKVCTRLHVTFTGETKEDMQNLRCIIANHVSLIKFTRWKFEYFLSFWFLARERKKYTEGKNHATIISYI